MVNQVFIHVGSMQVGDNDVHVSYDATYDEVQVETIKIDGQNAEQPPICRTHHIVGDIVPGFTAFIDKNIRTLRRQDYVVS